MGVIKQITTFISRKENYPEYLCMRCESSLSKRQVCPYCGCGDVRREDWV